MADDSQNFLQDLPGSDHSGPDGGRLEPLTATTFCRKCNSDVVPVDGGRCPVHRTFLPGHQVTRKHPIDIARRDARLAELTREFPPRDAFDRDDLETLADTIEDRKRAKSGSAEWDRLGRTVDDIRARLRSSSAAYQQQSKYAIDLSRVSDEDLERSAEALLADVRRYRERRHALALASSSLRSPSAAPLSPTTPLEIAAPLEVERCTYCKRTPEDCARLKDTNLHNWRSLHYSSPDEIDRRAHEEFETMIRTMRHGSGITRW